MRNKYGPDSLQQLTTSSPPTRRIIRITPHSAGFRAESLRILDNECMEGGVEARSEADHLHNDVPRKHGASRLFRAIGVHLEWIGNRPRFTSRPIDTRSISILVDVRSATDYVSLITRRLLRIALSKNAAVNDESIVLCYTRL